MTSSNFPDGLFCQQDVARYHFRFKKINFFAKVGKWLSFWRPPKSTKGGAGGRAGGATGPWRSLEYLENLETWKLEISTKIGSKMCIVFVCTRRSGTVAKLWMFQSIVQVGAQVTPLFEISGTCAERLVQTIPSFKFFKDFKGEALKPWIPWKLGNLRFRPTSGRKCALYLFAQDGQGRAQNFELFNPLYKLARMSHHRLKSQVLARNVLCKQFQVSSFSRISKVKPWSLEYLENLETWDFDQHRVENVHCICLHKTVRDGRKTLNCLIHCTSWRACHTTVLNLRYLHGTSCANNSKFQVFQGFKGLSLEALNTLKTLKLEISTEIGSIMCTVFVCTRRSGTGAKLWIV